jgi:hypothetical protein
VSSWIMVKNKGFWVIVHQSGRTPAGKSSVPFSVCKVEDCDSGL